jgi:hypothetical protein
MINVTKISLRWLLLSNKLRNVKKKKKNEQYGLLPFEYKGISEQKEK